MRAVLLALLVAFACAGNAWAFDFEGAARMYAVPKELLEAISKVESGNKALAINKNRNGSVDLGHMQVNSDWQKSGKIEWKKLTDENYCTYVGAWILAQEIQRFQGNVWAAVAAYNTGKSASQWDRYAESVDGEKRTKALELAKKARSYTHAVYAAYAQIMARKGMEAKEDWRLNLNGAESRSVAEKAEISKDVGAGSSTVSVLTAPMAVVNPYGSYY